jgi:16S rRNA (cytosine967-C5)-methyltransferase
MTPGARLAAAIDILDRVLAGANAEQALTNWGRASRFAGSGDRLAVRDVVYDSLRCLRSCAVLGGGMTGRGVVLGLLRAQGIDPAALFTGDGHAPAALTEAEAAPPTPPVELEALDCPDWLAPALRASLGADFAAVMQALRVRARVFVRVNTLKSTPDAAIASLAAEGITARPHDLSPTALEVTENARKLSASTAFLSGMVEVQDAASQAVVDALPLRDGMRVLDYCAGGGGKTLAMAARARLKLTAHDIDPRRMGDLPARAARSGVRVTLSQTSDLPRNFDLVLADAPCSGSGSWRRAPQSKWTLTPDRLEDLTRMQDQVLDAAATLVAPGGWLAYATCSLLDVENADRVSAFSARQSGFGPPQSLRFLPTMGGDGFFLAQMQRK